MKIEHKNLKQSGFAIVEAIFAIVITIVIIGGGVYLFQRKSGGHDTPSTSQY